MALSANIAENTLEKMVMEYQEVADVRTNSMKQLILLISGFAIGLLIQHGLKWQVKHEQATYLAGYNQGFRAGSVDILNQLVECEGITDPVTLEYRRTARDTVARLGELDTSQYPCSE